MSMTKDFFLRLVLFYSQVTQKFRPFIRAIIPKLLDSLALKIIAKKKESFYVKTVSVNLWKREEKSDKFPMQDLSSNEKRF